MINVTGGGLPKAKIITKKTGKKVKTKGAKMRIYKSPVNLAATDLSLLVKCKTKQMVAAFLVCVSMNMAVEKKGEGSPAGITFSSAGFCVALGSDNQ